MTFKHLYNFLSIITLISFILETQTNPLSMFQWKNRIILVSGESSVSREWLKNFLKQENECLERDLVVIRLTEECGKLYLSENLDLFPYGDIRKYYNLNGRDFRVILIGKDGGIKFQSSEFIKPEVVFTIIDGMPMRKREMKKK